MAQFNLRQFLQDVFAPQPDEKVAVLTDMPHGTIADNPKWKERRQMADEWATAMASLTGSVYGLPYDATGAHNADLPPTIADKLADYSLVLALTEFSATAPLSLHAKQRPGQFRAASMPGIERRMEQSGLAADYQDIQRRCAILQPIMQAAKTCEVDFDTGDHISFDLSANTPGTNVAKSDDGYLHPDTKKPVANLPAGEAYQTPNEEPGSDTVGIIPIFWKGHQAQLQVVENRITNACGCGPIDHELTEYFTSDPARGNIAECAFGCNPMAIVTGTILEDEKAGFHFAWGRSDHLGGLFGVDDFQSPSHVVHQDIVYAKGNPIQVRRATLIDAKGRETVVINDGEYVIF